MPAPGLRVKTVVFRVKGTPGEPSFTSRDVRMTGKGSTDKAIIADARKRTKLPKGARIVSARIA